MSSEEHSKLGRFVRVRERSDGTHRVFVSVPAHLRPPEWPPNIQIPEIGRTDRSLSDAKYRQAVIAAARRLNAELDQSRAKARRLAAVSERSTRELVELYRETKRYKALGASRKYRNIRQMGAIVTWSERRGRKLFANISKADVEASLAMFDHQPSKQLDVRSAWNILCREAVALGWRADNPAELIPWTAPEPEPANRWQREDVEAYAMMAVRMGQPGLAALIRIQYATGQRLGDLTHAKHGRNFNGQRLTIRQSKTGAIVNVLLPKSLCQVISDVRLLESDYLFNDFDLRGRFTPSRLHARFVEVRGAVAKRGQPLLLLQKLRHSAVCELVSAGVALTKIASVTGHNVPTVHQIIKRYAIDRDSFADQAMKEWNRAMGGSDDDFADDAPIENEDWLAREGGRRTYEGLPPDEARPGRYLPALTGQHRHKWRLPDELVAWPESTADD